MASFKSKHPFRARVLHGCSRKTATVNRTKENEELSVSNSQRVCTFLQHSSIRPSLGITISFSLSLTYPGGSTWLPWIANLANKELSQATQAQTFFFNVGHSTSSFKGFSQPGPIPLPHPPPARNPPRIRSPRNPSPSLAARTSAASAQNRGLRLD